MMYDDDRYFDDWNNEEDWEEENERVYDFWDIVMGDMQKEMEAGKCHTHVYVSIEFPAKMVQYCCMNSEVCTSANAVPSYSEADALLTSFKERGYELQYDLADGLLYRYDWNAADDRFEHEQLSLEKAVGCCKEWTMSRLEEAKTKGLDTEEICSTLELFSNWFARFANPCIQLA